MHKGVKLNSNVRVYMEVVMRFKLTLMHVWTAGLLGASVGHGGGE